MVFKKGHTAWNKGLTKETDERVRSYGEKHSFVMKKLYKTGYVVHNKGKHWDEKTRQKMKDNHADFSGENHPQFGTHHSEITITKIRNKLIGMPSGFRGKHHTEKSKQKLRDSLKKTISEHPEVLKKMLCFPKPNYRELQLQSFLSTLYPNEWKYVGDGSVIIEGKNPDFINCNGKKLIIELFGEHWHERGEEETRTKMFKQYGYDTLIIWAKELNKRDELESKIREFINKHHSEEI